jgi:hypothetical protein
MLSNRSFFFYLKNSCDEARGKLSVTLISEMKRCKTIKDCHEVATMDAYDENEAAVGWLTCIEEMFSKFKSVNVLGNEVTLDGFGLKGLQVMAKCRRGRKVAFVSLESVEFPKLTKIESLWLNSLKGWSKNL